MERNSALPRPEDRNVRVRLTLGEPRQRRIPFQISLTPEHVH
jgi:hypothetical protein